MLIEFSVANFRSIAEEQTLSMAASVGARRRQTHSTETGNAFAPRVLKTACVFGPNASGKTSLIRAVGFFTEFVVSSAKDSTNDEEISVSPFRFDGDMVNAPSNFEVIFVTDGTLYQYGFSVSSDRVVSEWMFSRSSDSNSRMREVFSRNYDDISGEYTWTMNEALVRGERELWRKSTRSNALFFSTAIQLNSESLRAPFVWIQRCLRVIASPDRLLMDMTAQRVLDSETKGDVLEFLNAADLRVDDVEVLEEDATIPKEVLEMFREPMLERIRSNMKGAKDYKVRMVRRGRGGQEVQIDIHDESDGSKVLFSLAGPWMEVLAQGYTLFVDELHNSLHPLALRFLVGMFHDPHVNPNGAQLIFTSHETSVISRGFMHRDQIWLMEKGYDNASHLYPLSDFSVREVDAFQRAYLSGRFGALPRLKDFRFGEE